MHINYITIIGLTAAALTAISSSPQMIKVLKTKCAEDWLPGTYWVLTIGVFLWTVHGILIQDLPVIAANVMSLIFVSAILIFKIRHK